MAHRIALFGWGVVWMLCVGQWSSAATRSALIPPTHLRHDVTLDIVTPHIPWAKPLASQPIRALFIGPAYGHRETAETAQRLSLDLHVLFSGTNSSWTQPYLVEGQTRTEDVLAVLREKLAQSWDCIVIGNLDWPIIPDDVVELVGRKVAGEGVGLIYVMYSQTFPEPLLRTLAAEPAPPPLADVLPLEDMQTLTDRDGQRALEAMPQVQHFRLGKGRVVLIRYAGLPPDGVRFLTPDPNDALAYEYCQALLIKNLIYASGKSSGLKISAVDAPRQIEIDAADAYVTVRYQIDGEHSEAAEKIADCVVRDTRGRIVAAVSHPLVVDDVASNAKDRELRLPMPSIPAGLHFIDVTFRHGEKVLDWGTAALQVISPLSITSIELLNDVLPVDGKLAGQVVVAGGITAATGRIIPDDATVAIKLFDNHDRLYAAAELPNPQFVKDLGAFARSDLLWFSLPVEQSLTTINRARAELWRGGRLIAAHEREFYVPRYAQDEFIVGVWGHGERIHRWSHISKLLCDHQVTLGVDANLLGHYYVDPGSKYRMAAGITRSNQSVYPYIERISYFETDPVRQPCLTDPVFLGRRMEELASWSRELRKLGCIAFNLGDEVNLSAMGVDVCFSPTCQESFRSWLKAAYGDELARVNESWGTSLSDWEQVSPITQADARESGSMARWLDHRLHMTDVMMDYMVLAAEAIASQIPDARSGPEGIWGTNPYYGVDWEQLARRLDVVFPYMDEPLAFSAAGSLVRPGSISGTWMGGYPHRGKYAEMARYDPWYALLHGLNSVWFYSDYEGTATHVPYAAFGPDFRLNQSGIWFFEEVARIQSGIGALVLNSRRQHEGVGILLSTPSCYLEATTASDLIMALRDAGFVATVVTVPQLLADELQHLRVLVLPNVVAMSDEEAAAVDRFTDRGGIVLADLLPATHTAHGRKLEISPLAQLFGVTGAGEPAPPAGPVSPAIAAGLGIDTSEGAAAPQPMLAVESHDFHEIRRTDFASDVRILPIAGEGGPDIGIRATGSAGKAILLNFSTLGYIQERHYGRQENVARLLRYVLAEAGVEPVVRLEGDDVPGQGMQFIRYRFDGGELLAVLREELAAIDNPPRPITLQLPSSTFVIDLQTGQRVGLTDRIALEAKAGPPALYALLDAQPGELSMAAPREVAQGEKLQIDLRLQQLPTSVCRLTFLRPDQTVADYYTRNVVLENGGASAMPRLALNDAPGQWTVRASDVITGQTVEAGFMVKQRGESQ